MQMEVKHRKITEEPDQGGKERNIQVQMYNQALG